MKAFIEPRAKQSLPEQIVADLLGVIRRQFLADLAEKEWYQHRRFLLRVVTWPAAWLNRRGVSLPPARYKAVFLGILDGVKVHGATAQVKYWPGYLLHCVQEHFKHHGDELYEEAKSVRHSVERALSRVAPGENPADTVEMLSQVNAIVSRRGHGRRQAPIAEQQPELL